MERSTEDYRSKRAQDGESCAEWIFTNNTPELQPEQRTYNSFSIREAVIYALSKKDWVDP